MHFSYPVYATVIRLQDLMVTSKWHLQGLCYWAMQLVQQCMSVMSIVVPWYRGPSHDSVDLFIHVHDSHHYSTEFNFDVFFTVPNFWFITVIIVIIVLVEKWWRIHYVLSSSRHTHANILNRLFQWIIHHIFF